MTIKIYDCSNSEEKTSHRSVSLGPKQNDVMKGLAKYAYKFGCKFVTNYNDADVIMTNDIYPSYILSLDKPKVKRMDGVYWTNKLKDRNESLNLAARQSDYVIFISEYSRQSYRRLYEKEASTKGIGISFVILNDVDNELFYPRQWRYFRKEPIIWTCCASNWEREEKRFNDLMVFVEEASAISKRNLTLNIIGKCDIDINKYFKNIPPVNVNLFGYIEEYSECLRMSDAFVNLSYRDPAPKVVCQAVNCGLPILYANSGGTPDLVKYGIGIKDPCDFVFEEKTPSLKPENILKSYCKFIECYGDIFYAAQNVNRNSYMNMLSEYFAVIKRCA